MAQHITTKNLHDHLGAVGEFLSTIMKMELDRLSAWFRVIATAGDDLA